MDKEWHRPVATDTFGFKTGIISLMQRIKISDQRFPDSIIKKIKIQLIYPFTVFSKTPFIKVCPINCQTLAAFNIFATFFIAKNFHFKK
jgi:hypothetical protein